MSRVVEFVTRRQIAPQAATAPAKAVARVVSREAFATRPPIVPREVTAPVKGVVQVMILAAGFATPLRIVRREATVQVRVAVPRIR